MTTIEECKQALTELEDIWNNGNPDSLPFCRYMRRAIEELSWEMVYCDNDIPADIEERFNILEDDIYEGWYYLKIKRGECSMTLIPIGE